MGMIGRWIDTKCRTEPEVMRRVLGRKFGDLKVFVEPGGKCGCLLGSYRMERDGQATHWGMQTEAWSGKAEAMVGWRVYWLTVSVRGDNKGDRKRPDATVIRMLKQRIRKSLGIAPENRQSEATVLVGERTT